MVIKQYVMRAIFLMLLGLSSSAFAGYSSLIQHPALRNEKFVIAALRQIHGAQLSYQSTTGSGNFGTFNQLQQAGLIDSALAYGYKYNYLFQMTIQNNSPSTPAHFAVFAKPRFYPREGMRSFYVDESGLIRGADRQGGQANQNDPPIIESYTCTTIQGCEAGAIASLRTLSGAEAAYQGSAGKGNYGSFQELFQAGLIDQYLATGFKYNYLFRIIKFDRSPNTPARFYAVAVPQIYRQTGVLSFYIDETGVLRGADKKGGEATVDDPPVPD